MKFVTGMTFLVTDLASSTILFVNFTWVLLNFVPDVTSSMHDVAFFNTVRMKNSIDSIIFDRVIMKYAI
jgi:hypothetical protein